MANGAFKFKDNSGNVVASLSNSGSNIVISGGTLDLSGMTGLTLGNVTMSGTTQNASTASFAPSYLLSSSFNSYTGTTNAQSRLSSLEIVTGSVATTGSNVFIGTQTITGSLYISANLVVQGSSSLEDITGSNVYIGTNKINLNTDTPAIRFGGISVFDSGSNFGESGSLLWDSQGNRWLYQHPYSSGAPYKSAILISGPQNSGSLGSEATLTSGKIQKAVGDDHIGDSVIYESNSTIGIGDVPSGTYGKLSVFGGISIKDDLNAKLEIGRYSSGVPNSYIKLGTNSNSLRFTNNTDLVDILELTNSGNLGLGVTPNSWSSPFNVIQGGSYGQSIGFQSNGPDLKIGTNNYYSGSGYFYNTSSNGAAQLNVGGNSGFQFNTAPTGTSGNPITFTSVMSITNGGVVGIGITNPSSAYLDIVGTNTSTNSLQLRSGNVDTGTTSNQILFGYNGTESYRHAIKTRHMSDAMSGNSIDFYVWKYGTNSIGTIGTQHVMSLNGGNVGIGITTPTALLHLSSNTPYIYIDDTSTSGTKNRFQMVVGDVGSTQSTNFGFNNVSGTSLTDVLTVNELGRVGIGTTSPSQKLSIGTITGGGTATSTPTCVTLDDTFGNNTIGTNLKLKIFQDNSTNRYGFGVSDSLLEIVSGNGGGIGFFTNGANERARLNTNGQLSLPYQPAFYAYNASGGGPNTRTTGAFTAFNLTRVNRGSHYNTSTGRFTAPIAGVYEFIFSLLWRQTNDSSSGEISIGVNGSNISSRGIAYTYSGAANDFHDQTFVRVILSLSAGDYVTGWVHSSGSSTGNWYYGDNLAHFSGYLLG